MSSSFLRVGKKWSVIINLFHALRHRASFHNTQINTVLYYPRVKKRRQHTLSCISSIFSLLQQWPRVTLYLRMVNFLFRVSVFCWSNALHIWKTCCITASCLRSSRPFCINRKKKALFPASNFLFCHSEYHQLDKLPFSFHKCYSIKVSNNLCTLRYPFVLFFYKSCLVLCL